METLTDLIYGLLIGIALGSVIFALGYILLKSVTFAKENHIMHVMIGERFSGRTILASSTLYIEPGTYDIKELTPGQEPQWNFLGLYWVGLYPFYSIHKRHQQWKEWNSTERGREIRFRDEMTPYLIAKPFEYAMMIVEAEDKNGVPLNVYFTVIIQPCNALLPIFGNDDAYGQVQTMCQTEALLFVKQKTFSDLGGQESTTKVNAEVNDEFSDLICKLNAQIPGRPDKMNIQQALGYKILGSKLDSIEIAGAQKGAMLEATTVKYVAEEKAKAKIAEAKGGLEAAKLEAEGKQAIFNVQSSFYREISEIPGAMKVEERRATPQLTTLVESGAGTNTGLMIGDKK